MIETLFGYVEEEEKKGSTKGKDKLKPMVTIAYRCERCGKLFARSHPKDPQVLCERCREQ